MAPSDLISLEHQDKETQIPLNSMNDPNEQHFLGKTGRYFPVVGRSGAAVCCAAQQVPGRALCFPPAPARCPFAFAAADFPGAEQPPLESAAR